MRKTIHCLISGRVQGVCFRMYTQQQARIYGVTGWVRNLQDGRVEVLASGEENSLKQMKQWLRKGPSMARVTHIEVDESDQSEKFEEFTVR